MRVNPVSDIYSCDYFCKLNGIPSKYYETNSFLKTFPEREFKNAYLPESMLLIRNSVYRLTEHTDINNGG